MFDYVAFVWDPEDREQAAAQQQCANTLRSKHAIWRMALDRAGVQVYCTGIRQSSSAPCLLDDNSGVVLGALFPSTTGISRRRERLSRTETEQVLSSKGRQLIRSYWGRYVAILCSPSGEATWILRDPTGGRECLTTSFRGVRIFFSSMRNCPPLDLIHLSINWDYVHSRVFPILTDTWETGLNEVTRLVGGECMEIGRQHQSRSFYWHPFDVAQSTPIEDDAVAVAAVRQTVSDSVHTWAGCYDGILQMLSGGLDSSIVVSCLARAPSRPRVTCLNYYYTRASNSDERGFARLAAQQAGYALLEWETDSTTSLQGMLEIPRHHSPYNFVPEFALGGVSAQFARAHGAQGVFAGMGGDEVFLQSADMFSTADYLASKRLSPALFGVAMNAARLRGLSVWRALANGWQDARAQSPAQATLKDVRPSQLANAELAASVNRDLLIHPWLRRSSSLPPGKMWQACSLAHADLAHSPFAQPDSPEEVFPLMTQPVMELGLRIPSYVQTRNGWTRIVAREAFAQDLRPELVWRRGKCIADEYPKHLLASNVALVRSVLLEGELALRRIIHRQQLEVALDGGATRVFAHATELLNLFSMEVWLSSWKDQAARAAA
jgi:asparagine synthase (glutamine-hydrolysing)